MANWFYLAGSACFAPGTRRKAFNPRPRNPDIMPETKIVCGDALDTLRRMQDNCVHCVVTSPPYFGLRDYGVAGQMGAEQTPSEYVQKLVDVFREVRRVLRKDGTCWLNLGDSYASAWVCNRRNVVGTGSLENGKRANRPNRLVEGLKEKDLIGIPWRVAFALQEDGWYLRQDIIWHKPNPMPESVRDRCTKAHEYLFLLTKSEKYYFDADAIAEASVQPDRKRNDRVGGASHVERQQHSEGGRVTGGTTKNRRSVWTIAPKPYKEAHFATFPSDLVEPCIAAGTSEHGCCPNCATPWARVIDRKAMVIDRSGRTHEKGRTRTSGTMVEPASSTTLGFYPQCDCIGAPELPKYPDKPEENDAESQEAFERDTEKVAAERQRLVEIASTYPVQPGVVMDIFGGAGTTGLVAQQLNRHCILIELNPEYVKLIEKRLAPT